MGKVKAGGEESQVIECLHPSQQMDFCTFACFQQTVSEKIWGIFCMFVFFKGNFTSNKECEKYV